jgi:hypothetical protein
LLENGLNWRSPCSRKEARLRKIILHVFFLPHMEYRNKTDMKVEGGVLGREEYQREGKQDSREKWG